MVSGSFPQGRGSQRPPPAVGNLEPGCAGALGRVMGAQVRAVGQGAGSVPTARPLLYLAPSPRLRARAGTRLREAGLGHRSEGEGSPMAWGGWGGEQRPQGRTCTPGCLLAPEPSDPHTAARTRHLRTSPRRERPGPGGTGCSCADPTRAAQPPGSATRWPVTLGRSAPSLLSQLHPL